MRARRRGAALAVLALLVVGASSGPPASAAAAPDRALASDFDGDGYADLVVGVPDEDSGSAQDAGAVNVVYGSAAGLTADGDQLWSQDSRGVPGKSHDDEHFGTTTASGDFDADGYADLAVGAPGETIGGRAEAGGVTVLYGTRDGLRSKGSRFFSQATRGVPGDPDPKGAFGTSLVAGDFDGDDRDDLAIGAPMDDIGPEDNNRGSVTVLLGSRTGLRTTGAQSWDTGSILGQNFASTGLGLDSGDFNADGRDDLAVLRSDAVTTLLGAPKGLTSYGSQIWDSTRSGIAAVMAKPGEISSVAVGDFNGDRHADLALGSRDANRYPDPSDDCFVFGECDGAIAILPGTTNDAGPVTAGGRQILRWGVAGVSGFDNLGRALAAGDVDGDGRDELAAAANDISYPKVDVVRFAAGTDIRATGSTEWLQAPLGQVSGTDDREDRFAETLQVAQLGRGPGADLVIGVPGEAVDGRAGAGRVVVVYGTPDGLTVDGQQSWSQASPGIRGTARAGDAFGALGR